MNHFVFILLAISAFFSSAYNYSYINNSPEEPISYSSIKKVAPSIYSPEEYTPSNLLKESNIGWSEWFYNKAWGAYKHVFNPPLQSSYSDTHLEHDNVQSWKSWFYEKYTNAYLFAHQMLWQSDISSQGNDKAFPIETERPQEIVTPILLNISPSIVEQTDNISPTLPLVSPHHSIDESLNAEEEDLKIDTIKLPEFMAHLIVNGLERQSSYILKKVAEKDSQVGEKFKNSIKNLHDARRKAAYLECMHSNWHEVAALRHKTKTQQKRQSNKALRNSLYRAL